MELNWIALATAATMATAAAQSAGAAERLSLSTWGSPQHYQVAQFVPVFEDLLDEMSDGDIRLKVFEGGEMVKQQFVSTAIPEGSVDISLTTLDNWSGRIPEVGILTTPLWSHSIEWTLENVKPGMPVFEYFNARLEEQGAVLLAMFDIGAPVLSASFDITGPESLKGRSIRAYSKGGAAILQALGASPTIMSVGDVYSGLQRGTVDAATGGLGGAVGLKHYEVTSTMLVPNGVMGTLIHAYVMNKDSFEDLSPEYRQIVLEAATEARDLMQRYVIDNQQALIDEVRENGNEVISIEPGSEMWNAFAEALAPFTEAARESYSTEVQAVVNGS